MIKSNDDPSGPAERSGEPAGKCWHREPGAGTIRLQTEDKGRFLFPYFHLVFAHLEDADDGSDLLTLGFPSHKAEIRGKRLQPIFRALEDLSAAWVRVLPSRYAALAPEGGAVVIEITVRSLEEEDEE
jgi:hypothetical protein